MIVTGTKTVRSVKPIRNRSTIDPILSQQAWVEIPANKTDPVVNRNETYGLDADSNGSERTDVVESVLKQRNQVVRFHIFSA